MTMLSYVGIEPTLSSVMVIINHIVLCRITTNIIYFDRGKHIRRYLMCDYGRYPFLF